MRVCSYSNSDRTPPVEIHNFESNRPKSADLSKEVRRGFVQPTTSVCGQWSMRIPSGIVLLAFLPVGVLYGDLLSVCHRSIPTLSFGLHDKPRR